MEYTNELTHWGIKGMKWGVRRYQNKDGTLTKAGKKRYDAEMAKIKAETKKIRNQQRTAAKLKKLEDAQKNLDDLKTGKKPKADEPVEDVEAKKARILQSRSPKELYDNANLFTYNELNAAKLKLQLEADIKRMEPATVDKGKAFTNKFIDSADQIASTVQSGTKAYNSVAKVYNALYGNGHGKSLPLISDSVTSKLDKFKEETDWIKAKNERKKAVDDSKEKAKSDLDKLKEETAKIDAENKNREAKRASREHDRKDQREAEKAQKEADEKRRAEEMKKYEEYNRQYTDPQRSGTSTYTDSSYRNAGGDRDYVNPDESRSLVVYNKPASDISARVSSMGKTYTTNSYDNWDDYVNVDNDPSYPSNRSTSASTIALGQRTIAGLLTAPKDDD